MSDKTPANESNVICYYDAAGNFLSARTEGVAAKVTGIFDKTVGSRDGWYAAFVVCRPCNILLKAVWPGRAAFPFQCPKCRKRTADHLEDIA